jgi:hypothetical protein
MRLPLRSWIVGAVSIASSVDEGAAFGTGGKSPFDILSLVLVIVEVPRNWRYILSNINAVCTEFTTPNDLS